MKCTEQIYTKYVISPIEDVNQDEDEDGDDDNDDNDNHNAYH